MNYEGRVKKWFTLRIEKVAKNLPGFPEDFSSFKESKAGPLLLMNQHDFINLQTVVLNNTSLNW
jgi:hypothetical protein